MRRTNESAEGEGGGGKATHIHSVQPIQGIHSLGTKFEKLENGGRPRRHTTHSTNTYNTHSRARQSIHFVFVFLHFQCRAIKHREEKRQRKESMHIWWNISSVSFRENENTISSGTVVEPTLWKFHILWACISEKQSSAKRKNYLQKVLSSKWILNWIDSNANTSTRSVWIWKIWQEKRKYKTWNVPRENYKDFPFEKRRFSVDSQSGKSEKRKKKTLKT